MSHFRVITHCSEEGYTRGQLYEIMEPFCEQTENHAYLEFEDLTEDAKKEYQEGTMSVFILPDGSVKPGYYECKVEGARKEEHYPFTKMYPNFDAFATDYHGYTRNPAGKYGYYCNPNAFFDWFTEGGRFGAPFLVKADAGDRDSDAPDGFKWVTSAKKSDICWNKMLKISQTAARRNYETYLKIFKTGEFPEHSFMSIKDDTLYSRGNELFKKGDTLHSVYMRENCNDGVKYPVMFYGAVDEDGYTSRGNMGWFGVSTDEKDTDKWFLVLNEFLEKIPDDDIIVALDCHI